MPARAVAGPEIEALVQLLAKLPGLGPRSARRAALHLVKKRAGLLEPLAAALSRVGETVRTCSTCGNLDTRDPCSVCTDPTRAPSVIVVVEDVGDLWALERAGVLSALDGVGPEALAISRLVDRARDPAVREIVIAVNATVEGQTTAHYLMDELKDVDVAVSRLAHGVPVGGELDYLDEGTLSAALRQRRPF